MGRMKTDLECRLLCAAEACHLIGQPGGVTASPQYAHAGFVAEPAVFEAGTDDINACLVGTTGDGVVLSFRGTLTPDIHSLPSLIDWINDLNAKPKAVAGVAGKVHSGFARAVSSLWRDIVPAVKAAVGTGRKARPLYVTGHSKGGSCAAIAAALLQAREGITAKNVIVYAPARPGDAAFAKHFDSVFPDAVRYEYQDDLVPHLPPRDLFIEVMARLPEIGKLFRGMTDWNYASAGTLRFIDWKDRIVGDSFRLELRRFGHLAELIATGKLKDIAADHALIGGYCGAVCAGDICAATKAAKRKKKVSPKGRG